MWFYCMSRFYMTQCVITLAGNGGQLEGGRGCTLAISFKTGARSYFSLCTCGGGIIIS